MKQLILLIIAIYIFSVSSIQAKDIVGTYYGNEIQKELSSSHKTPCRLTKDGDYYLLETDICTFDYVVANESEDGKMIYLSRQGDIVFDDLTATFISGSVNIDDSILHLELSITIDGNLENISFEGSKLLFTDPSGNSVIDLSNKEMPYFYSSTWGDSDFHIFKQSTTGILDLFSYKLIFKVSINEGDQLTAMYARTGENINVAENIRILDSNQQTLIQGATLVQYTTESSGTYFITMTVSGRLVDIQKRFSMQINIDKNTVGRKSIPVKQQSVYTSEHNIIVENTTDLVKIYTITGRMIATGIGANTYAVPDAGMYIVKVGEVVTKVIVE